MGFLKKFFRGALHEGAQAAPNYSSFERLSEGADELEEVGRRDVTEDESAVLDDLLSAVAEHRRLLRRVRLRQLNSGTYPTPPATRAAKLLR